MRVPDWTQSGDTDPQFANGDASQYGFLPNSTTPSHGQFTEVWVRDASTKRHGTYGIRVTCFRDSYSVNTSANLNVRFYPEPFGSGAGLGISDDKEEWFGWSWLFPTGFPQGSVDVWSLFGMYIAQNRNLFPAFHTYAWDPNPNSLELSIRVGQKDMGGNLILPPSGNGYAATETILGPSVPNHPYTKGVWHDFYTYILWKAQSPGILDIWHRQEGGTFSKVYSNRNDGSAVINRASHPTFYWNATNGVPTNGTKSIYMCYRTPSGGGSSNDVQYWADGFFARQSQTAVLAEFPSIYTERELRVRGLLREQIQSWRLEKRPWAWIKKTPVWTAFKEVGGS